MALGLILSGYWQLSREVLFSNKLGRRTKPAGTCWARLARKTGAKWRSWCRTTKV